MIADLTAKNWAMANILSCLQLTGYGVFFGNSNNFA